MFDFLVKYADLIYASMQLILTLSVMPTIINQFRCHICSVPLSTSVIMVIGLSVISAVLLSTNFPLASITAAGGAVLWAIIGIQRLFYNRKKNEKRKTHNTNTKFQPEYDRICSPISDHSKNTWS